MARAWKFGDGVNTDEIIPGRPLRKPRKIPDFLGTKNLTDFLVHWWKQSKNYIDQVGQVVRKMDVVCDE